MWCCGGKPSDEHERVAPASKVSTQRAPEPVKGDLGSVPGISSGIPSGIPAAQQLQKQELDSANVNGGQVALGTSIVPRSDAARLSTLTASLSPPSVGGASSATGQLSHTNSSMTDSDSGSSLVPDATGSRESTAKSDPLLSMLMSKLGCTPAGAGPAPLSVAAQEGEPNAGSSPAAGAREGPAGGAGSMVEPAGGSAGAQEVGAPGVHEVGSGGSGLGPELAPARSSSKDLGSGGGSGDLGSSATAATLLTGADSRDTMSPALSNRLSERSSVRSVVDVKVWQIPFHELEILKQIGEGSFGRVYTAKWRETLVAVKLLLNTGVNLDNMEAAAELALSLSNPILFNLQQEASLMAALRHPNIVGFLGVCPTPPCVVTDYCAKGSLQNVLRAAKANPVKARQLDWGRRLGMALDAAKGMLYLHLSDPPILHRDLKSPNLLVDNYWRVKVSDFNLSKIMEDTASGSSMAANNPRWLAPEVLDGHRATLASDVWSFGVVLWELLTFEIPWGGRNQWQIMKMVTEGQRLQIPDRASLPRASQGFQGLDAYEALIHKCWAEDPAQRPNFTEIISDLRDLLTLAIKQQTMGRGEGEDPRGAQERPMGGAMRQLPPSMRPVPGMQPPAGAPAPGAVQRTSAVAALPPAVPSEAGLKHGGGSVPGQDEKKSKKLSAANFRRVLSL